MAIAQLPMDLKSLCQHCGQNLEYPDNMQGDQVGCPHCNQLTVLGAAPVIQPPVLSNAQNPNLSNCPDCGRTVSLRATSCPHCGGPITLAKPSPSASSKPQGLSAPAVVTPPQAPKAPVSRLEKVIICTVALGAIALVQCNIDIGHTADRIGRGH